LQCRNCRQFKDSCAFLPMMLQRAEQAPELKPKFPVFEELKVKPAVDC
jgi:hypothetical protein